MRLVRVSLGTWDVLFYIKKYKETPDCSLAPEHIVLIPTLLKKYIYATFRDAAVNEQGGDGLSAPLAETAGF